MRTWLVIQRHSGDEERNVTPADREGIAEGACPCCKAEPFRVVGCEVPQDHADADRVKRAGGYCVGCGDPVGYIYAETGTLFGRHEDMAVLQGRCRVY